MVPFMVDWTGHWIYEGVMPCKPPVEYPGTGVIGNREGSQSQPAPMAASQSLRKPGAFCSPLLRFGPPAAFGSDNDLALDHESPGDGALADGCQYPLRDATT
jgi:hypothetical protein